MTVEVEAFGTMTVAMCVFFLGSAIVRRVSVFRTYSIPEPVVGGFAFAICIAIIYHLSNVEIVFDLFRTDLLLVYFFAALGLRTNIRDVAINSRPLLVLVLLATVFIFVQNFAGMALAAAFDRDLKLGIVAGSMSLMGRSGTAIAWVPVFEERFAIEHGTRIGITASVAGLVGACVIGGPIVKLLIQRFHLQTPGQSADLDVGISRDVEAPKLDYYAFLLALLRIHIAIIAGQIIEIGFSAMGVGMPLFIFCMIAGVLLGNILPRLAPSLNWEGSNRCLSLIAYVSLGLFYTMYFMSIQLWAPAGILRFVLVSVVVQALLTVAFTYFVVFRAMGRDYEAAVIAGGFAAMSLGSTASTLAIMTAVAKEYGRAHKAFVIVPLACGFFVDIANSLAISFFAAL